MNYSVISIVTIALVAMGTAHSAESVDIVPTIFAPGILSGPAHDSAPAFTPSGDVVYFGRSNPQQSTILVSERRTDGLWSEPHIAPFSGIWNDMEPAMSPDGRFLVFISNRPDRENGPKVEGFYNGSKQNGGRLWHVDRQNHGWSAPTLLPTSVNTNASIYAPSVAADGSLYFMTPDAGSGKFRLFRAQSHDGSYLSAQPLPFSDGTATDVDPAVAPDESFLVFGSGRIANRGIDLFIVFRDGQDWGEPIPLGDDINTPKSDAEPRLAADGQTLYFSSERVVPVQFPRTPEQAQADVARMQSWDNGNYNIWQVPLSRLMTRVRQK